MCQLAWNVKLCINGMFCRRIRGEQERKREMQEEEKGKGEKGKGEKNERKERKKRKRKRKRERGTRPTVSSSVHWRFDGRNSLDQGV